MRRRFSDVQTETTPTWVRKTPVGNSPVSNVIQWVTPFAGHTREHNLEALQLFVEQMRLQRKGSGYAFDLLVHFVDHGELDPEYIDEKYVPPTAMEAGDLFRTLMLDERWDLRDAEQVYYAACGVIE